MERNTYLEGLYETFAAYDEAKAERRKERDRLVQNDDWDAVRAFDEREEKEFPRPYTNGQSKAYQTYIRNLRSGNDGFFEVKDLPWDYEMEDFINTLRKAGITSILVTDESTALLRSLFQMAELGCSLGSLKEYSRIEQCWGKEEDVKVRGIEMTIV